jgi:MYXO-CTERM domain-containing protein
VTARHLVATAALAAASFAMTTEARAYVRERTDAGAELSWRGTNCVPIVAYPRGFSFMTTDEVATATTSAAAAWSHGANACTYLTLTMTTSTDAGPVAIPQPHAAVVFRETQWCKVEPDGTCSTKAKDNASYDQAVLMLTSTAVDTKTGQMLEGATEVNGHDYQWADLALHPASGLGFLVSQDLQNGLTHEFGHFIGLDHTCAPAGANPWPVDDLGNPVPDCDNASAAVRATTMFPSAAPGDLSKRTLEPDDINGVCGIYPVAQDPGVCAPPAGIRPSSGGCNCSAATANGTSPFALGALVALALRARSRRRGAHASR